VLQRLVTAWLALALVAGCASSAGLDPTAPPPVPLEEGWEVRWAEEGERVADVAREGPGEPGWQPFRPGVPPEGRGARSVAWFHVRLPAEGRWADPALFLGGVDTDFELYVDGQLLTAHGTLTPPFSRANPGVPWHLVRLPPGAGGQVLALKVRSGDARDIGPVGRIAVGGRAALLHAVVTSQLEEVLVGLLCACAGVVALGWALRSQARAALALFALYALSRGAALVSTADVRLLVWDAPGAWYQLFWLGASLAPVAFAGLADALFGTGRGWFTRLWRGGLLAALAFNVALAADFWRVYPVLLQAYVVALPALLLAAAAVAAREALQGHRVALAFLAALLGHLVGVGHDLLVQLHWLAPAPAWDVWSVLLLVAVLGVLAQGRWQSLFSRLTVHARELEEKNAQLQAAESALQAAVQTRDVFLSVASHELRTPLTALTLRLQRLAKQVREGAEPLQREALLGELESVRRQTSRLGRLTEDLLDVTRLASGPPSLRLSPVDLAALVREAVGRARDEAERVDSPLSLEAPATLVGQWDAMRLEQVVTNLLSNALKYGAGKPVRVVLERVGPEGPAGLARLVVEDRGVGIPPEAQERIFERFERVASVRHFPGLGLGLWIAREIVSALGGTLGVTSVPGEGSRFVLELPVSLAGALPAPGDVARAG
jgi:signal transduction histidine kinase